MRFGHRSWPSAYGDNRRSVQIPLPVSWYAASGARHLLVHRVVLRVCQDKAVAVVLVLVVPEPLLVRFEALYDGVPTGRRVASGVL